MKRLMKNKQQFKEMIWAIVCVLIGANCIGTYSIKSENEGLRREITNLRQEINEVNSSVNGSLMAQRDEIERILAKDQSLFTTTSVDFKVKGKKLEVTIEAVPKVVSKKEKIFAKIITDHRSYEQELNEEYKAVVDIDITERLEPIIIIQTDGGVKQEVLEEQYTDYIFQDMVRGSWEDNGGSEFYCNAWLQGSIEAEDIISAKFIIEKMDVRIEKNEGYGSTFSVSADSYTSFPKSEIQGIVVPAQMIKSSEGDSELGYRGDFSQCKLDTDGTQYDVYFELITKDGLKYITAECPIASFCCYPISKRLEENNARILPIIG